MAKWTKSNNPHTRSRAMVVRRAPTRTIVRTRTVRAPRRRSGRGRVVGLSPMAMAIAGGVAALVVSSKQYNDMTSDKDKTLGGIRESYGNGPLIAAAGYAVKRTVSAKYGNALMALGIGMAALRFVGKQQGADVATLGVSDDELAGDDDDLAGNDDDDAA